MLESNITLPMFATWLLATPSHKHYSTLRAQQLNLSECDKFCVACFVHAAEFHEWALEFSIIPLISTSRTGVLTLITP